MRLLPRLAFAACLFATAIVCAAWAYSHYRAEAILIVQRSTAQGMSIHSASGSLRVATYRLEPTPPSDLYHRTTTALKFVPGWPSPDFGIGWSPKRSPLVYVQAGPWLPWPSFWVRAQYWQVMTALLGLQTLLWRVGRRASAPALGQRGFVPRSRKILLRVLVLGSAAIAILGTCIWAQSYWHKTVFRALPLVPCRHWYLHAGSERGSLRVSIFKSRVPVHTTSVETWSFSLADQGALWADRGYPYDPDSPETPYQEAPPGWRDLGARLVTFSARWDPNEWDVDGHDQKCATVVIRIPHWALVLPLSCPAILYLATCTRCARRLRRGLCPACAYDLRATPERCPECGRETTVAERERIRKFHGPAAGAGASVGEPPARP
jgi:hypothetical protein